LLSYTNYTVAEISNGLDNQQREINEVTYQLDESYNFGEEMRTIYNAILKSFKSSHQVMLWMQGGRK